MKGHPWILEINSGPGLQGTTLVKYTAAFKAKIAELQKPVAKKAAAPKKPAARKQVAAVGAAPADAEAQPGAIGGAALRLMMNQVNTPEEAQKVANILVSAGIKVIMNYTSIPIKVPKKVKIETTDPIEKLLHTLYYLSHTGYAELNSFKHK